MNAAMTRFRRLEDGQNATVDSCLEEFRHLVKAMRIPSPPATRRFSYYRGAGRVNRSSVQCYYYYQFPCCPEGGLRPFPRSG